jgi:hypothetical protein
LLSPLLRFYCHVDIVRGALTKRTRYDRVDVHQRVLEPGSCHHIWRGSTLPAGLQLAEAMMTRIRIIQRCTRGRFAPNRLCGKHLLHIVPYGPWQFARVRNAASFFVNFVGVRFFVWGVMHPHYSVGPSRQREALLWLLPRRAGSSGILWRIHSLVKMTLHRHRAGFKPQRAS